MPSCDEQSFRVHFKGSFGRFETGNMSISSWKLALVASYGPFSETVDGLMTLPLDSILLVSSVLLVLSHWIPSLNWTRPFNDDLFLCRLSSQSRHHLSRLKTWESAFGRQRLRKDGGLWILQEDQWRKQDLDLLWHPWIRSSWNHPQQGTWSIGGLLVFGCPHVWAFNGNVRTLTQCQRQ